MDTRFEREGQPVEGKIADGKVRRPQYEGDNKFTEIGGFGFDMG